MTGAWIWWWIAVDVLNFWVGALMISHCVCMWSRPIGRDYMALNMWQCLKKRLNIGRSIESPGKFGFLYVMIFKLESCYQFCFKFVHIALTPIQCGKVYASEPHHHTSIWVISMQLHIQRKGKKWNEFALNCIYIKNELYTCIVYNIAWL